LAGGAAGGPPVGRGGQVISKSNPRL